MSFPLAAFGLLSVFYWLYRWKTRTLLSNIPGPDSHSWVHGNLHELLRGRAGQKDFEWSQLYGSVVRFKGPLGADQLLITDLKAIQFMFQRFPYQFVKNKARKSLLNTIVGPGLANAEQDAHKRQRKIMLPAFGPAESKALVPIFNACAAKMCTQLSHMINESSDESVVVNIIRSVSNATLDAIGQAAFDYDFGVLDDNENILAKSYQNAMVEMFAVPSKSAIMVFTLLGYIPARLAEFVYEKLPSRSLVRSRKQKALTASVSRSLVERKSAETAANTSKSRDVLSLVVKANLAEQGSSRLYDDEMISQMQTIMGAGHETTSNSLSFLFLELCKHPEMQSRIRDEIRMQQLKIQERGESEFTAKDFDDMLYLTAVIKETLRFNPVAYNVWREPLQDVIIPLSDPLTTKDGQTLFELPVPKGTKIVVSIAVYNRSKELFGPDANSFNPERWFREDLAGKKGVGVFASLMTFGAGPRSCIGWRFAVLEMQAFIVEMIKSFEFIATVPYERVRREGAVVMSPTIEGELEKGVQLPLRIRVAPPAEQ